METIHAHGCVLGSCSKTKPPPAKQSDPDQHWGSDGDLFSKSRFLILSVVQ